MNNLSSNLKEMCVKLPFDSYLSSKTFLIIKKLTKPMYFQGIFHLIVIYGLSVLRVCFGPLPIFLCNIVVFLNGFSILFGAITVAMYTFARFMFVCVWKRMRQMDDNLIVRIAIIQAIVMNHSLYWRDYGSYGFHIIHISR